MCVCFWSYIYAAAVGCAPWLCVSLLGAWSLSLVLTHICSLGPWVPGAIPPASALSSVPIHSSSSSVVWSMQSPLSSPSPAITSLAPVHGGALDVSLSPLAGPLPRRLLDRVISGQFVEMRDFLADNMLLLDRLESTPGLCALSSSGQAPRPRLREVVSPVSWIVCFMAYMAVLTKDPVTKAQLAYARFILCEAQCRGGTGWIEYDRAFRQLRAVNTQMPWESLDPGLYSRLILGRQVGTSTFCVLCQASDHTASSCALALIQQPTLPSVQEATLPAVSTAPQLPNNRGVRRRPRQFICISWNKGSCSYPGTCVYRHICATCQQRHMAKDCDSTPVSSEYKQGASQQRTSGK